MRANDWTHLPNLTGGIGEWERKLTRLHDEEEADDEQRDPCLQTLHEQNEALRANLQFEQSQLRARGQMAYDNGLDAGRKQGSARERRRIAMPLMLLLLATALLCWGLWQHGYAQGKAHEQQITRSQ